MNVDFKDDIRQALVVASNEIKKFMVGKKIILFGILVLALEALNLIVPYVWGDGYSDSVVAAGALLGNINLFIIIAAILFTATSIVSEFEERTALVLFTKPIRKWSIFLGKLVASIAIMVAFLLAIYLYTAIVCQVTCGNIPGELLVSLGLAICGCVGASGLAILLSSIAKKGSTASIMTLVVYLLVLSILGSLISTYGNVDTWWMLDEAMGNISYCIQGVPNIDIYTLDVTYSPVPVSDLVRATGVMWAWGIATSVAGYFLFDRRDF